MSDSFSITNYFRKVLHLPFFQLSVFTFCFLLYYTLLKISALHICIFCKIIFRFFQKNALPKNSGMALQKNERLKNIYEHS
ncbi:MAG: hypothetical protein A3F72_17740 [Bacteroidetes bacterium RIFCSPLOWO2_12_FULL_35_15]|nr:MAG: hypothetical protein A3F72_17740 [Bacteroidetes bacterium RIFCSPLOWO2_12_FULL_35_15]